MTTKFNVNMLKQVSPEEIFAGDTIRIDTYKETEFPSMKEYDYAKVTKVIKLISSHTVLELEMPTIEITSEMMALDNGIYMPTSPFFITTNSMVAFYMVDKSSRRELFENQIENLIKY